MVRLGFICWWWWLVVVPWLLLGNTVLAAAAAAQRQQQFIRQLLLRVHDRVDTFMNVGPSYTARVANLWDPLQLFPHSLRAPDRDLCLKFLYASLLEMKRKVFFGFFLEDGVVVTYDEGGLGANYREPGFSGYTAATDEEAHALYYNTCVDRANGNHVPCQMEAGSQYVEAITTNGENPLVPCPAQQDNNGNGTTPLVWCQNYRIRTVQPNQSLGYVPRSYSCIRPKDGRLTQTPGQAATGGNCTFADGTPVDRVLTGPYAQCGGRGKICNSTHTGVHRSRNYDHRYRSFYTQARTLQKPHFSDPYTFFSDGNIGTTFSRPLYDNYYAQTDDNSTNNQSSNDSGILQKVFKGVVVVDYQLQEISSTLVEIAADLDDQSTIIAIYEIQEPNYVVGLSTGSSPTRAVYSQEPDQPCPKDLQHDRDLCSLQRTTVSQTGDHHQGEQVRDTIVKNAHFSLQEAGFPDNEIVVVKDYNDTNKHTGHTAYAAQSIAYVRPNQNLEWRIVVASPIAQSTTDAITLESELAFALICILGSLGCVLCLGLLVTFVRYRKERTIMLHDWKFSSAFLVGCILLNASTFALLGENTKVLCQLRPWTFFLAFSTTLSPLFVKIWRMFRLLKAAARFRRDSIPQSRSILYTLPIIVLQFAILLVFTFVDPPLPTETLELTSSEPIQHVTCQRETPAFFVTSLIFTGGLILVGCGLAYQTRNMDANIGEARQLIFQMYNIAFTGALLVFVVHLVDTSQQSQRILQGIAVFWGTTTSSVVFVLPLLVEARRQNLQRAISGAGGGAASSMYPQQSTQESKSGR